MEKAQLAKFRQQLETRQGELKRNLTNYAAEGRNSQSDTAQDVADQANDSYNKEFLLAQSSSDRQFLAMVESALERLRLGSFGECVNCGTDINVKRLEAVPWTRHCIACQEKLEQGRLEDVEA